MSTRESRNDPYPFSYDTLIDFRAKVLQMIALVWEDDAVRKDLMDNPRAAFRQHLQYDLPYPVDAIVSPDNAQWCPPGFQDWVVQHNEEVTLFLPPPPQDARQRASALAAYNAKHLTPFTFAE